MNTGSHCKSPLLACLLFAVMAAVSPVSAQDGGSTTATGAADPCAMLTEGEVSALAGVPMLQMKRSEALTTEARVCMYMPKAASAAGVSGFTVSTYMSVGAPAVALKQFEAECEPVMKFQREPQFGPLSISCVDAGAAQITGFKGRSGLIIQLSGKSPGLLAIARRGFAMAVKKLP